MVFERKHSRTMTSVVGSFKLNPGKRFKFDLERSVVELEASLIWELASGGEKGTTSEALRCRSGRTGSRNLQATAGYAALAPGFFAKF